MVALNLDLRRVGTTKEKTWVIFWMTRSSTIRWRVGREFRRQWTGKANIPQSERNYHVVLHLGTRQRKRTRQGHFYFFYRRFTKPSSVIIIFPVSLLLASRVNVFLFFLLFIIITLFFFYRFYFIFPVFCYNRRCNY